ncbi:hypothetical protein [Paraburkholderia nodosa]|uniref:hypothetical protein n=1 Tax=Paraburkholderia nodosa TaxID=392320 RepID=UPI00114C85BA|nr:hypothetical protein [Paraburkholderia nodosa]
MKTSDELAAARLVATALQHMGEYAGPWHAAWLVGPAIGVPTWTIKTRRSREVDDQSVGNDTIRWDFILPNGSSLDSPVNALIQQTSQKIAFLVRQLPSWGVRANSSHKTFITNLHFVIRWLFEYEEIYKPAEHAFELLDEVGLDAMFYEYIEGGSMMALHFPRRILHTLCSLAPPDPSVNTSEIEDIFRLHESITKPIIYWLRDNDFYDSTPIRGETIVSLNRSRLCELISFDYKQLTSQKCNAFLRQFEPELLEAGGKLLIPVNKPRTEYFSHKTVLLEDARNSKCSAGKLHNLVYTLGVVTRSNSKINHGCPRNRVDCSKYHKLSDTEGSPDENTPLMPIEVAIPYAAESIRWIVKYADPLIDFYLKAARHFVEAGIINHKPNDTGKTEKREKRNKWIRENIPADLATLNISRWGTVFHHDSMPNPHEHLRKGPGLHDLIDVLIGAVLYILIETCDLREGEVRLLKIDSLRIKERDGYWIQRGQEKQHVLDELAQKTRPCPDIVARALLAIRRLRDGILTLKPKADPFIASALFYVPDSAHNAGLIAAPLNRLSLIRSMETFCDYVALPVDEYGRRWYVRPHESRKSCLVTFFSCAGFSALDVARWMAGHKSLHSIFVYLKKNTPRDRFLAMEAQLASAELWRVERKSDVTVQNAEDLYLNVCRRFGVRSISAIPRSDLDNWLTEAFQGNIYALEVASNDGAVGEFVAFVIGDGDETDH